MSPEYQQSLAPIRPEFVAPQTEKTPRIVKTPLMLQVEERFAREGETIGQLLARLYQEDNLTFSEMSRRLLESGLKVSDITLRNWMKVLNSQIKIKVLAELRQVPQFEQYRISQARASWQDPEKRKQMLAKRNKSEGYINRRIVLRDPEIRAAILKRSAKAKRRKDRQNRRAALGRSPQKALRNMAADQGLSASEIATKIGRSEYLVRNWLKEYEIKAGLKPLERRKRAGITDDEIEQRREKIKRARSADLLRYLSPRQQQVLLALYPEQGAVPTQPKVADDLHRSRERIRQLNDKGLAHLDRLLESGPDALKRKKKEKPSYRPLLEIAILGLTNRTYNSLGRTGVHTIAQLEQMSDEQLMALEGFGKTSLADLREKLEKFRQGLLAKSH